jgi:Ca2+-binding EF-hand superfamily protein
VDFIPEVRFSKKLSLRKDNKSFLSQEQIRDLFKQNNKQFESEKLNEIMKMNHLLNKAKFSYEDLVTIWEADEKIKD